MGFWDVTGGVDRGIINGVPSGMDNDHGSIRAVGSNIDETTKWSNVALGEGNRVVTVPSGTAWVHGPFGAGAYNGGDHVIRRATTDIAGVSNNIMLFGASNSAERSTVHQVAAQRSLQYKAAIRTNKWNSVSGAWEAGFPEVVQSGYWSQEVDQDVSTVLIASGVDQEATVSGGRPGEFTYRDGSPNPVNADYPQNTTF